MLLNALGGTKRRRAPKKRRPPFWAVEIVRMSIEKFQKKKQRDLEIFLNEMERFSSFSLFSSFGTLKVCVRVDVDVQVL